MTAILEAYASDDRRHVDYYRIEKSEEFRRFFFPYFLLCQFINNSNRLSLDLMQVLKFDTRSAKGGSSITKSRRETSLLLELI